MTISDYLMIAAVLVAPFLAVFAQDRINIHRERRANKLWVFRSLMATRGNRVSLEHVQALNSIDLILNDANKDKQIIQKWNEYLDHLAVQIPTDDHDYSAKLVTWTGKGDDLLVELLGVMGDALGYKFDKVKIRRGVYFPKAHGEEQLDNFFIRKGMARILAGGTAFPVNITNIPKT